MRSSAIAVLLAAALPATLAACGGGSEGSKEERAVREALTRFDAAQAKGDAAGACRTLVAIEEQGRVEVPGSEEEAEREREAAGGEGERDADASAESEEQAREAEREREAKGGADPEVATCERAFARAAASRKALKDVEVDVRSVAVQGDRATAAVRTRLTRPDGSKLEQDASRRLVRRDERWRVLITEE